MKNLILLLWLAFGTPVFAQQNAVTETGEEVVLYDNGTWEYKSETSDRMSVIPTNPEPFIKDENSTFLLKSTKLNVGFWLDPQKWSFTKATDNEDAEYQLNLKGEDLYGMIITEKIQIPLETLKIAALSNAKAVSTDIQIVNEEYRNVNGLKVLQLRLDGTIEGIKYTYYGYYYSNTNGSVQVIMYTAKNLIDDYLDECETLLNGLVELD